MYCFASLIYINFLFSVMICDLEHTCLEFYMNFPRLTSEFDIFNKLITLGRIISFGILKIEEFVCVTSTP